MIENIAVFKYSDALNEIASNWIFVQNKTTNE
jgi:hypothetical protein